MKLPSHNQPYWTKGMEDFRFPTLPGGMECDVLIVGGGITGITAAAELYLAGKKVAVIDTNLIGGGTTGHSTGHLDNNCDRSITQIIKKFGEEKARIALQAKRGAMGEVERLDQQFRLNSDLIRIPGYLYTERREDVANIEDDYESARKLGLTVTLHDTLSLPFPVEKVLMFAGQARFSPLAYVRNLAQAIADRGCSIYENTRALNMEEKDGSVRVETNRGIITARHLILAGHTALFGVASLQARINPQMSYVIAIRTNNRIADALYWDTDEPYHYTRVAASGDSNVLIIGGADHHTGDPDHDPQASFRELEEYAQKRYWVQEVLYRWSHEYFESADGLPYIGKLPGSNQTYVAAAYSGDGLSFGTAAGVLLCDLVTGKANPAAEVFDPSRKTILDSMRQMAGTAKEMVRHFAGERITSGDVHSLDEIPPDEGRILRMGGEKLAIYRDAEGELHALSAACTHMGCIVHWNGSEKTWDCACHGSRFSHDGQLIMGPAKEPLEPKSIMAEAEKK